MSELRGTGGLRDPCPVGASSSAFVCAKETVARNVIVLLMQIVAITDGYTLADSARRDTVVVHVVLC